MSDGGRQLNLQRGSMGRDMRLGAGNRWDEMTAMAAILVLIVVLIVLAVMPGDDRGPGQADVQPRPVPTLTATPGPTTTATRTTSTPQPLPDFDILEQRGITSLSRKALSVAEPISFRRDAAQEIPAPLCVHWKVFRHDAVTGSAEVVAEFFESCDETIATTGEPVPDRLVRLENAALREQLSFIVSQLSWEEYLTVSRRYAQARVSRALEALVEGQPPE